MFFFFQAEDGIRDVAVTGFRRVLFRSHWNSTQRLAVGLLNGWHNASTSGCVTSSRDSKYAWITPWRQPDENPSPQAVNVAGVSVEMPNASIPMPWGDSCACSAASESAAAIASRVATPSATPRFLRPAQRSGEE